MHTNPMFLRHAVENQKRAALFAAQAMLFRDYGYLEESEVYQQQAARRAQWAMKDMGLLESTHAE